VTIALSLAQGGYLKRDLPTMVDEVRERHSNTEFRVTPTLGDAPKIIGAVTEWVERDTR